VVPGFDELPMTSAFLERLPTGWDSYPEVRVKGSIVRGVIEHEPPGYELERVPEPLRSLLANPPLVSDWLPETHLVTLTLAFRDIFFQTDAAYLDWAEETLGSTLRGPLYRILFALISPGRLARSGAKRWGALRVGTSREHIELNENGNLGRIHYPAELYDPFFLETLLRGMTAVYRLSKAADPKIQVLEWTPESALIEVLYDQSQPRGAAIG
jgi:hypothetical protein